MSIYKSIVATQNSTPASSQNTRANTFYAKIKSFLYKTIMDQGMQFFEAILCSWSKAWIQIQTAIPKLN
jgi:hypothetical protein